MKFFNVSFPRLMAFALLYLWSGCVAGRAQPFRSVVDPYRFGPACGSYTVETAVWNLTQTVTKTGGLTGLADSKALTLSFWIKKANNTSNTRAIIVTDSAGIVTYQVNIQSMAVTGGFTAAAGGAGVDFVTSLKVGTNAWTHVLITFDVTSSALRHIYINGVEDGSVTWTTYNNTTLDLTPSGTTNIGINHLGNNIMDGALAEFWFDDVYLNDLGKFACTTSGVHPISLGSTGNLPTGSAPAAYFSRNGSGNSWATDSSGNGNTMTVAAGTLSSTTPP